MTRWARAKTTHQQCKQPNFPTPWKEFFSQRNEQTIESDNKINNEESIKSTDDNSLKRNIKNKKSLNENLPKSKLIKKRKVEILKTENETKKKKRKLVKKMKANELKDKTDDDFPEKNVKDQKLLKKKLRKSKLLKKQNLNMLETEDEEKKKLIETMELNCTEQRNDQTNENLNKVQKCKKKKKKLKIQLSDESIQVPKNLEVNVNSEINTNPDDDKISPPTTDFKETDKKLKRKEQLLNKLKKKREQKGMILLSQKVENKIYRIKVALRKKGKTGEDIKQIIRDIRRKEELKFKKETFQNKQVCFQCRQPGHRVADCPGLENDIEQGTGICFKCGSTEHKVNNCSAKIKNFPYAKCFICGTQGHLSRDCPDNKKGLYPYGGGCKECGKNDHLKINCPELQNKQGIPNFVLPTMKTEISADADIDDYFEGTNCKPKIIKF